MRLKRVISGGQTGADRTGLEEAKKLGLETGGTVPKGCRTDEGKAPELVTEFGCVEHSSREYKPRTYENVRNADVTVWFGKTSSPGYYCTKNAAKRYEKQFYENPTPLMLEFLAKQYAVWNVAGNRKRMNPSVMEKVRDGFKTIAQLQALRVSQQKRSMVCGVCGKTKYEAGHLVHDSHDSPGDHEFTPVEGE